ncbi:Hsp20/alpha crystallin family protein [Ornithinibacillus halotolerans]|uniref:Molecular chaperone Hsp20 n=1 Tax=Ornithinibacillus halotolerans TaxID=1274357 RepID=A0A916WCY1_9BACI|nr:Hsp20/alpha crystallin family protein [Ornithinibacillus halotolerans]GGA87348.1 molecular chaperone Hsp20 [Ornithinibacillus halotolerans]
MSFRKKIPSRFDIDMSPLHDFMKNMDSFFNQSFKQMNEHFHLKPFWIDVTEDETQFLIRAELPDYNKEQIFIEVVGNRIRISIEDHRIINQEDLEKGYKQNKQSLTKKERIVTLPFEIPKRKIKASFKDGLLSITVPKPKVDYHYIEIENS